MKNDHGRPVKTTLTSFRLLEYVKANNGASLTELADELDLAKSTVHNHLATLTWKNFLVKEGQEYHVGLATLEFGMHARDRTKVFNPAKVQAYRLAESANEEVCFAVPQNGFMYTIEYVMGDANPWNPEAGSDFLKVGSRFHLHDSAVGKAVLAEYDANRIAEVVDRHGLPETTENTITDREELFEELKDVRDRGYAVNDEERERGFRSIAAPVTKPDESVVGSLLVGGPAYRFEIEEPGVNEMVVTLQDMINSIEAVIEDMVSAGDI